MTSRNEDGAWFAAKRYGYGADLPIAWQGWALLGLYVAVLAVASLLIPFSIAAFVGVAIAATLPLLLVISRKTRGGWRWRWGERD